MLFRTATALLLSSLLAAAPLKVQAEGGCSKDSIASIACNPDLEDTFGTLCSLVVAAGLGDALSSGKWTVFAPTNESFDELLQDEDIAEAVQDIDVLTEILLYHTINGHVLYTGDLKCGELYEMSNGRDTRHVCKGGDIFQRGAGNDKNDAPEIIDPKNVCASNGVIHTVNKVILPKFAAPAPSPTKAPKPACTTIADIACNKDDDEFNLLCAALKFTGLDAVLADEEGKFTVFAPTDAAFINLLGDDPAGALADIGEDDVADLLLFHVVAGEKIPFDHLECGKKIEMANMVDSKTVCFKYWDHGHYSYYKAQKGSGNSEDDLPWIILEDVKACNGIIHVIDEVMLPYH